MGTIKLATKFVLYQQKYKQVITGVQVQMIQEAELEEALIEFTKCFPKCQNTQMRQFSTANPFIKMLQTSYDFQQNINNFHQSPSSWKQNLTNIKNLIKWCQKETQKNGKFLYTEDIDLMEIAQNQSKKHILKLFEIVLAMLMESANKESHIQKIMSLNQSMHGIFAKIVQNSLEKRFTSECLNQNQDIQKLRSLNQSYERQLQQAEGNNRKLKSKIVQLTLKLELLQEELHKVKSGHINTSQDATSTLVQTLKQKIITITHDHQVQLVRLQEEMFSLQEKNKNYKKMQDSYYLLKQKYNQISVKLANNNNNQGEKKQLVRTIQLKQNQIKMLQKKLQDLSDQNGLMQETELHMRMELQKKQVRFKQLQKEVKTKFISPSREEGSSEKQIQQQQAKQQIEYLQQQLQKLRNTNRDLQREAVKLRKRVQKINQVEMQKKKIQGMILEVSKSRQGQIQLLLGTLYELRNENIKLHQMVIKKC